MNKHELLKEFFDGGEITIIGEQNIPNTGTNLFLASHTCMNEIFLMQYLCEDSISIVSCNSLFGYKDRKELYNKLLTPFPLEVRAGKHYTDICLKRCADLLKNGKSLIIFPEGLFTDGTYLAKAKTGAIRIFFEAIKDNPSINIVPVAITIDDLTKERAGQSGIWEGFKAKVEFLPSFNYSKYVKNYNEESKKEIVRNLTDDIMEEIAKAKNVPYQNEYGKLYDMEGFFFPDGEFVKFEDSENEEYYKKYSDGIDEIYIKTLKG